MIGRLIALIIPLGIGLAAFLAVLLAHNGHPTKGTWTLLISSGAYLLLALLSLVASFFDFQLSLGGDTTENLILGLLAIVGISIVGIFVGAFLMTSHWRELSLKTADLEKLATQLATERDEREAQPHSS